MTLVAAGLVELAALYWQSSGQLGTAHAGSQPALSGTGVELTGWAQQTTDERCERARVSCRSGEEVVLAQPVPIAGN